MPPLACPGPTWVIAVGHPDMWPHVILGVSAKVLLDAFTIKWVG